MSDKIVRKLTHEQYRQVYCELEKLGQDAIVTGNLSMKSVAETFTTTLGFPVTKSHLEAIYKAMKWDRWPSEAAIVLRQRIDESVDLKSRVERLESELRCVFEFVSKIK